MPVAWNADPPGSAVRIEANLGVILASIVAEAPRRLGPTVQMAQEWHRATYAGVTLPVAYFAGEIRDTDPSFPELFRYEVAVGMARGLASADVPAGLISFEAGIGAVVGQLDRQLPVGARPASAIDLQAVLLAAAIAHGEWIRIHPFANGNGRNARLWANWIGARYGLPLFVALRPRPAGLLYAGAAAASMRGDHGPMVNAFLDMLTSAILPVAQGGTGPDRRGPDRAGAF